MAPILLFIIIVVGGYLLSTAGIHVDILALPPSTQSAAALEGIAAARSDFSENGTLVFYPNNVVPVPYLFYADPSGSTVAKALVFPNGPPSDLSAWAGARVNVTGDLGGEHVTVASITYLSPP